MYNRFQSIPVLLFQLSFSILIPMFFQQPPAVSPRLQVTKSAVPVASSTSEPKRPTRKKRTRRVGIQPTGSVKVKVWPILTIKNGDFIHIWLVVYQPLWKMMEFVSWDDEIPRIWKKQKCSKPPTRCCWFQWFGLWDNSLETMCFYSKYTCRNQFCYHNQKLRGKKHGMWLGGWVPSQELSGIIESASVSNSAHVSYNILTFNYLHLDTREDGSQSKCHI